MGDHSIHATALFLPPSIIYSLLEGLLTRYQLSTFSVHLLWSSLTTDEMGRTRIGNGCPSSLKFALAVQNEENRERALRWTYDVDFTSGSQINGTSCGDRRQDESDEGGEFHVYLFH